MQTKTLYRAPWDFLLIFITSFVVVFLLGMNILFESQSVIGVLLAGGIIMGCAAFGVYGYSIQDGTLKILRLGWSTNIALSDIESVEYKPNAGMGSIRVMGIGGVFGYIGRFRNGVLGHYKAYATHRKKSVVIQTKKKEYFLITPDDPEGFVQVLSERI